MYIDMRVHTCKNCVNIDISTMINICCTELAIWPPCHHLLHFYKQQPVLRLLQQINNDGVCWQ
jgi:hypothetical protein